MLLTLAVVAGLIAGSLRAILRGNNLQIPPLTFTWLVFVAVIPQLVVFEITATAKWFALFWVKAILIGSQILLLGFVWANRKQAGIWLFGIGLVLNLFVILLNGGLMPISPDAASHVYPETLPYEWSLGNRLDLGKDIILEVSATRLPILSDRFHLPAWFPYRVTFSLGDVFIALGVFILLWQSGDTSKTPLNTPLESSHAS